MDLRRFLDLYVSETQEHVRLLQRSLLALEREEAGGVAVDEAFRAAHTIKGLSAAMGYREVAGLAHLLEDRLEALRAGTLRADGSLIDDMLGEADALEAAINMAVTTLPLGDPAAEEPAGPGPVAGSVSWAPAPEGTATVAIVRLRADAPIKSARAMLALKALEATPGLLGSDPAEFDDEFPGEFLVFLDDSADRAAVESLIVRAGEVESVEFADPGSRRFAAVPVAAAPAVAAPAAAERQLRVDAARLDTIAEGIGELSVLIGRVPVNGAGGAVAETMQRMAGVLTRLQRDVLQLRMVPVREAFDRLPRVVRDASRNLERDVELVVSGDDVQLDRTIIEEIGDPLVHLLRNAVDHGIEAPAEREQVGKPARGRIHVSAEQERSSVRITIADDGRGVQSGRVAAKARLAGLLPADAGDDLSDEELFRLLSHPGLSTAEQVSAVSGRGVGMDIVVNRIRALGGAIDMQTEGGRGTSFSIRLPMTLALAQALRVRIGGEDYAIPLTHVSEAVELNGNVTAESATLELRGEQVPLVRMRRMLQLEGAGEGTAIITERGERKAALAVDELVGREQIVVKSFDPVTGMLPYFSGATLLADGRPALVLDPLSVI
jgi:two-component system, chemotaxis family, sensor kinase CheA